MIVIRNRFKKQSKCKHILQKFHSVGNVETSFQAKKIKQGENYDKSMTYHLLCMHLHR